MIEVRQESLNIEAQDELHRWFEKGPFSTLVKVADAQQKLCEVKALTDSLSAATGYPLKMEAANQHLAEAAEYAIFLKILMQFKNQKANYVIVKLS